MSRTPPSSIHSCFVLLGISTVAAWAAYSGSQTGPLRLALMVAVSAALFGAHALLIRSAWRNATATLEKARDNAQELLSLRYAAQRYIDQINSELATIDPAKDKVPMLGRAIAAVRNEVSGAADAVIEAATTVGSFGLELYGAYTQNDVVKMTGHLLGKGQGFSVGRSKKRLTRREQLQDLLEYHREQMAELNGKLSHESTLISALEARVDCTVITIRHWRRARWSVGLLALIGAWTAVLYAPSASVMSLL